MAFQDRNGGKHTNYESFKRTDNQLSAKMPQQKAAPVEQQGPPPIESDPEAMQCIQTLQQKGYTADDVEMAMGQSEQQEAPPPAM